MFPQFNQQIIETLFEKISIGLAVFDAKLRLIYGNPQWKSFIGQYTTTNPSKIKPGMTFYELVPGTEKYFQPLFERVLQGDVIREPAFYSYTQGIDSYWDVLLTPLEENGEIIGFLDAATDVTDQIRVKEYLEDQIFERTQSLVTLLQISRIFGSTLSLDALLSSVLTELKRLVEYDGCALLSLQGSCLEVKAVTGCLSSVYQVGDCYPAENNFDRELFQSHKAIKIYDTSDHSELSTAFRNREHPESQCVRSWMGLPLLAQEKVIGELILVHREPGFFNQVEENYVQIFSSLAAIALENARLYQREHERRHESERRQRVAEGLRDILKALNSDKPLEDLLQFIVEQAQQMMGADPVIRYSESLSQPLKTITPNSFPAELFNRLSAYTYSNPNSELKNQLIRGEYVLQPDYKAHVAELVADKLDVEEPQLFAVMQSIAENYACGLVMPILVQGKLFGSLRFFYREAQIFERETCQLAMMIAEHAALAIENSILRREAQLAAVSLERSRLARELHDSVTQTLFSSSLIAEILPRLYETNQPEAERRLGELRYLAKGALAEMRTLLMELRPNAIMEAKPHELLRHLVDAYVSRIGIPIEYSEKIDPDANLNGEQKLVIYRVAQEALNNIAKYAFPQRVKILFQLSQKHINLMVEDDGKGFDLQTVAPNHFGLGFMRERAESIGAQLKVISHPGEGTLVQLVADLV